MTQEEKLEEAKRLYETANADQKYVLERLFPSLAESKDESIRKALISFLKSPFVNENITDEKVAPWIAWLEKQGNKLADKFESKFKVGDYVVDNCGYLWRIEGVINQFYLLEGIDGGESRPTIEWVNNTFHLWDITKDARDGDVLVASDGSIFLFKGTIDCACQHYAALTTDGTVTFNEGLEHFWETSRTVCPATKEQRDTFMKAMADAVFTFDFGKKELKADEPFDEYEGLTDFERTLADICIGWIGQELGWKQYIKDNADALLRIAVEKFNSVQDAPFEQNPAWSEEDESNLQGIIDEIEANKHSAPDYDLATYDRFLSWLKSIKERLTWRPSDEQMAALSDIKCTGCISYAGQGQELINLYNDLKKLRKE